MRKYNLFFMLGWMMSIPSLAGGLLTNTNQNVAFLRNPSRDASIGIDGVYSNPAGVVFLRPGWHLSLNIQSAYQQRDIKSEFAPFALGKGNEGSEQKRFEGSAVAPIIPSIQIAYVTPKWSFQGGFAVVGGGGKATFENGLGSFESQVAMVPQMINASSQQLYGVDLIDGYSADMYMKGRQYYYGMQVGVGYKITENLAVYVGGRLLLADCNYYGYLRNVTLHTTAAAAAVGLPSGDYPAGEVLTAMGQNADLVADRALDCDQSGWSFMTVLGLDYKIGKWNLAAKYEFRGKMHLKNESNNTSGIDEFDDGRNIPAYMPAMFAAGVEYSVMPTLRLSAGYHHFYDKQAHQYKAKQKYLKGGTEEYLVGAEYDINKKWTASIGAQSTNYDFGKNSAYLSDVSFTSSSVSVGLGMEYRFNDKLSMNVAYFKTFYRDYEKSYEDYSGLGSKFGSAYAVSGKNVFQRTNDVFGVNLNISL